MNAPISLARRASALLLAACAGGAAHAGGLDLHGGAQLADVGLPAYPGAVESADKGDSEPGFTFGLWGTDFGFHVYVLKYRSGDAVDAVAVFYRDALGRYGPVLDCSAPRPDDAEPPEKKHHKGDKPGPVTCGSDHAPPGGRLYKAGTEAEFRTVVVRPAKDGAGSTFELAHEESHGWD